MKDISFDNRNKDSRLAECLSQEFDLIIIGGGITGAGIALDAALRGIKTLLLEKGDFASGTSSKSTKLIHGGLRYLKQLELGLVRETGMERAVAHRNIPHLVHPEHMLLPIVENGTFNKWSASLAISVYDWLAQVPKKDRKKSLTKSQTQKAEPLLNPDILQHGIRYSEYRTDDARLTVELIKAARREGAEAFNYTEVLDFVYDGEELTGLKCKDKILGKEYEFKAKQVVSAAGPWVDTLRKKDGSVSEKYLHLTKGVHIVFPHDKLPINSAVYFDAFDGRMIFAIPRGKVTYVGTSDTNYNSDLNRVVCHKEDIKYLIEAINKVFEVPELKESDTISSWAGLRPLIHEEGKSPSDLSRKDEIFVSKSGLVSIAGGKLTGFRKMAKRVLDLIQGQNKAIPNAYCKTKNYKIHSDGFEDYEAYKDYITHLNSSYSDLGISEFDSWYLSSTYGKNASHILNNVKQYDAPTLEEKLLLAEMDFVIEYEGAYFPEDFFNRRTGKIYFDIKSVTNHLDLIHQHFAETFQWDEEKTREINRRSIQMIKDCTEFHHETIANS